ncbi:unnamed protein product [Leuciscus chuanchicus]
MPSLNMGRSGKDPIVCTPADLHMLTLMETMKQQMNQLSLNVSVIMARMAPAEPVVDIPEEISLPLASLEEVDHFEGWLKNPGNTAKKQHLVGMLASIGGRDTKNIIFNILAHIFADSVAKSINWKGMNNKRKFSEMATKAIMTRAVRKNRMSDKATDTEINHYAIRWFNLACDRGGGRRARSHPPNDQRLSRQLRKVSRSLCEESESLAEESESLAEESESLAVRDLEEYAELQRKERERKTIQAQRLLSTKQFS